MRTNLSPTLFASLCILWCAAFSSSAQTLWQDGTGNWFTAGNWTGGVPTAGIGAEVDNGGTAQIAGGGAASASGLLLGNGGTGNVSVNGVSSLAVTNSIAISGVSTFSINGGSTVTSSFGGLNNGGIATVNGGSSWTMSQTLLIGNGTGSGTLNVNGSSTVSAADVSLAINSVSTATATIDGASTLSMTGDLSVGADGVATVTVKGGSTASDVNGFIGFDDTANGTVNVTGAGSKWTNSGDLTVGHFGTGALNITSAGTASNTGNGLIGDSGGSHGIVTVDGVGSKWTTTGNLLVGVLGTGTLHITGGGLVSSENATLAYNTNSVGTATVDGIGSKWTNVSAFFVGNIGHGTLHITNGGVVTNGGDGIIGNQFSSNGIATVDGVGSAWTNGGFLIVADSDTAIGSLTITNGGAVSNTDGTIGSLSGSNGTATVDGAGSKWTNSGSFDVGLDGHGILNITNGGNVTVNGSFARIAEHSTSTGTVTVDGAGSTWRLLHELDVARAGTGTLTIQNGGIVNMIGLDRVSIGVLAGSNGTLNILSGGTFTGFDALIAQNDNSTGLAVVNGAGGASTLQLGGNLFVGGDTTGPHGTGVLRVLNGGIVNSNRLVVLSTGTLEIGVNPMITVINPSGIEYDGGKLKTIADTTFSNNGSLQTGGVILDSNGFTSTLSGVYSGTGGVTKIGAGTMVLSGSSNYTGTTTINAGVLQVDGSISSTTFVNAGGTLAGSGTIASASVINGGIVSPGTSPGTLTIGGGYGQTSAGTLRIEIAGLALAQHDLLSVGTAASLNGTLQVLRLNNFTPMNGDRVTIINDVGGHSGTFSAVTGTFTGVLRPVPMYNEANDVYILFQLGSFNIGGLTPNQKSVAHNLDSAANDPAAANLIAFLQLEAMGNLPHDYDLIAPEELASIYEIGFSQAVVQNNNLQRRMDDVRAGSNGFCANNFVARTSGKEDLSKGADGKVVLPSKDGPEVYIPTENNRWGVFINGSGDFVNVNNNDFNAHGYDIATGDFTVGADYRLCDHFAIGIDAGYSRSTADLVDNGRVDVDGGKIGAYATLFGKGLFGSKYYVDAGVGGGLNDYDTRRTGLQDELVRGDTDGTEFNAFIAYGSDWTFGCFNIGTWSTVQYTNVSIDEFTETGSLAPLVIEDQDENSFRATTGVHASYDIKTGHAIFRPEVRVAYQHEYCDSAYQIDSQLASGAGGVFRVRGPRIGRNAALVGAGMNMQWNNRLSTYVYYDGVLGRNNYDNNAVSGGFRIGF